MAKRESRPNSRPSGCTTSPFRERDGPVRGGENSSPRAAFASSSSGAPDPKGGYRISSIPGAGNGPCSTTSTGRAHGADGECSPTTPPRSQCSWKTNKHARVPPVQDRNAGPPRPDLRAALHHHRRNASTDLVPASPVAPHRPETAGNRG